MGDPSFKETLLEQLRTLVTAGFGLVAALAWNEAIQGLVAFFFPRQSGLVLKFVYAFVVTAIAVFLTARISTLLKKTKN